MIGILFLVLTQEAQTVEQVQAEQARQVQAVQATVDAQAVQLQLQQQTRALQEIAKSTQPPVYIQPVPVYHYVPPVAQVPAVPVYVYQPAPVPE